MLIKYILFKAKIVEGLYFFAQIQALLNINYNSRSISTPTKGGTCYVRKSYF